MGTLNVSSLLVDSEVNVGIIILLLLGEKHKSKEINRFSSIILQKVRKIKVKEEKTYP